MTNNKNGKKVQNASRGGVKSLPAIPDGYVERQTDDGQTYIVPTFMIADFEGQKEAHERKTQLQLLRSSTGVSSALPLRCAADCAANMHHVDSA